MTHLQHTFETLEIYACNIPFQHNISLLLGKIKARRYVEFNGGSSPAVAAPRCSKEAVATRLGGGMCAWQGREPSTVTLARPRAAPNKASGRALRLRGG
jgi:hypothetical protein